MLNTDDITRIAFNTYRFISYLYASSMHAAYFSLYILKLKENI